MKEDETMAKDLLAQAVRAEPPLDVDPRDLLRAGRRRVARRRGVIIGGSVTAVVAAALGAAVLMTPNKSTEIPVLAPPTPNLGLSYTADPGTPTSPQTGADAPPKTGPTQDDRSKRLTQAFADAHLIPPGLTVGKYPDTGPEPLLFFSVNGEYEASAELTDSRGHVHMSIRVNATVRGGQTCAEITYAFSCTERTFPDGSRAQVLTASLGLSSAKGERIQLTVRRPNGSFLLVDVNNAGPGVELPEPGKPGGVSQPTRDGLSMTDEDLFKIAATPSIIY
jgi:hypothetical protein